MSYANTSRGRVVSLKAKLAKNSKGSKSVIEFLHEMRAIADDLALAQSPISEEDLVVHVITQLGDEFNSIVAALRVHETPIAFSELSNILTDFERMMKENDAVHQSLLATANVTQKHTFKHQNSDRQFHTPGDQGWSSNFRRPRGGQSNNYNRHASNGNRSGHVCQYCNYPGHQVRTCRKLARFLKSNNLQLSDSQFNHTTSPSVINNTTMSPPDHQPWLFDSGASHHATPNHSSLQSFSDYGGPDEIHLGNGNSLRITHIGHTTLPTSGHNLSLTNVLCVPQLRTNLISISKLCKSNHVYVEFFPSYFLVKDLRTGMSLMRGQNIHDVYYAPFSCPPQINVTKLSLPASDLHHRLGHPANKTLRLIGRSNNSFSSVPSSFYCTSCNINKSHKLPFSRNSLVSTKPFELIYTNAWGTTQKSIDGYAYYVIFVDHFTKYTWLYPLRKKSDVSSVFPQYKRLVEKFFNSSIISLFSDNGGEFQKLIPELNSHGISHFTTPPHTPEHNDTSERRHRHIVETGLSLLHHSSIPLTYWSYAFQTAVYLINRLPTPILGNKSPFESLFSQLPNYEKLKPFGCLCFPWLRPYRRTKLEPRSSPCVFLGYSTSQSAYKCLQLDTRRLYLSRHVKFVCDIFPFTNKSLYPSVPFDNQTTLSTFPSTISVPPPLLRHLHLWSVLM
ncbi:retrovirus-related pol polyprotein from transposon tnt 1-94 [Phtheirospermum japonicum]|uniref:Retrovirus-related pol polyprotein from transposon tnt 1-94 n=1 Tax=Phtheirospermum japonicum TaxID=374723 RepID=A0A830CCL1_9LAMI|nr:retrovirus-related pol polyprotein from transposon tnt 1-94 [Phtheirospermum japonicum]